METKNGWSLNSKKCEENKKQTQSKSSQRMKKKNLLK